MHYFVVVIFILLSVMSTVNVACSNQTQFVYVCDKRYTYLYTLVYVTKFVLKFNCIKFILAVTYMYHSYHLAHIRLKGYSSQKSIDFLLNPFCIKLVTIHFSACNFAIVYLYKDIKFKPKRAVIIHTLTETAKACSHHGDYTHIKGRLLRRAVILFICAIFNMGTVIKVKNSLPIIS